MEKSLIKKYCRSDKPIEEKLYTLLHYYLADEEVTKQKLITLYTSVQRRNGFVTSDYVVLSERVRSAFDRLVKDGFITFEPRKPLKINKILPVRFYK